MFSERPDVSGAFGANQIVAAGRTSFFSLQVFQVFRDPLSAAPASIDLPLLQRVAKEVALYGGCVADLGKGVLRWPDRLNQETASVGGYRLYPPHRAGALLKREFSTTHFRRPRITSEAQSPSSAAGGAPRGLFEVNLRRIFLRQTFGCAARGNLKRLNIKLGRPARRG